MIIRVATRARRPARPAVGLLADAARASAVGGGVPVRWRKAGQDLRRALASRGVQVVEPELPHAAEELDRGVHGGRIVLGEDPGGVAVGLELLPASDGAQLITRFGERAAGVAVGDVAVLVSKEEGGELGADSLHQGGVEVDDGSAALVRGHRDVVQRVGRYLTNIYQPLGGRDRSHALARERRGYCQDELSSPGHWPACSCSKFPKRQPPP